MKSIKRVLGTNKGILLKNTIMLYILQFSTYLFSFITVPYQTRILGPVFYGKIGVATAIMVYFQLFIDFGFLLSATEEVSNNRNDTSYLSQILSSVTVGKLFLSFISAIFLFILCLMIPSWYEDMGLYFLFLLAAVLNSMLPDFLYRGLEQMTAITIRTVIIKCFFTIMIFLVLKQPSDYYLIPILNSIGNLAAIIGVYYDLRKRFSISFQPISFQSIWDCFRRSSTFFYSRIASSIYTASNTLILGLTIPGSPLIGYYTSADKLITTAKSAMSPISDSLYPYMIKNKDFKLIKKILLIFMPIITVGCIGVWIWAEPICILLFGSEYAEVGAILRLLLPIAFLILPSYMLGFPTLSPVGLTKYANYSVIFSACIHVLLLLILFISNQFSITTLCIATSITATAECGYRIFIVLRNRNLFKGVANDEKDKEVG